MGSGAARGRYPACAGLVEFAGRLGAGGGEGIDLASGDVTGSTVAGSAHGRIA